MHVTAVNWLSRPAVNKLLVTTLTGVTLPTLDTAKRLESYEAQLLRAAGDVSRVPAAPMWRRVNGPN